MPSSKNKLVATQLLAIASAFGELPKGLSGPPPRSQRCSRCTFMAYEIKSRPGVFRCQAKHVSAHGVPPGGLKGGGGDE